MTSRHSDKRIYIFGRQELGGLCLMGNSWALELSVGQVILIKVQLRASKRILNIIHMVHGV